MSFSARKRYTLPLYTWLLYSRLPYTYLFLYLIPTSFSTSFDNIPCLFLPERDTLDSCIPGSVTSVFLYLIYISFSTLYISLSLPHLTPIPYLLLTERDIFGRKRYTLPERDTLYFCIPGFFTIDSLTHISFFTSFPPLSLPHLTPISSLFLPERDTLDSCIQKIHSTRKRYEWGKERDMWRESIVRSQVYRSRVYLFCKRALWKWLYSAKETY